MEGLILLMFLGASLCYFAYIPLIGAKDANSKTVYLISVTLLSLTLCFYIIPLMYYQNAKAKVQLNHIMIETAQEEAERLRTSMDDMAKLNPKAVYLENEDTPVASAMKVQSSFVHDLKRARLEYKKYKEIVIQMENGVFSYVVGN